MLRFEISLLPFLFPRGLIAPLVLSYGIVAVWR
jgi:hypothetical protein